MSSVGVVFSIPPFLQMTNEGGYRKRETVESITTRIEYKIREIQIPIAIGKEARERERESRHVSR